MTPETQYAAITRQVVVDEDGLRVASQKNVVLLNPSRVSSMIKARQQAQVVKFRSTSSDCVPNL
jgi:hypothetical protein